MNKNLVLGTAAWAWTVSRQQAFQILESWMANGHQHLDAATNYPINKNPDQFRAAEKILLEFIHAHGVQNLRVNMKIGSLNNLKTPDINLNPSFIFMMTEEYVRLFGSNLDTIMMHWDNRNDPASIRTSTDALVESTQKYGLKAGLSGLKYPEAYLSFLPEYQTIFDLQVKHNLFQSDLEKYRSVISADLVRTFAYGINAGGLKLDGSYAPNSNLLARGANPDDFQTVIDKLRSLMPNWNTAAVRPPIMTMNQIGMVFAGMHPDIHAVLLGASSASQLQGALDFWNNLEIFDYTQVYRDLLKVHTDPT